MARSANNKAFVYVTHCFIVDQKPEYYEGKPLALTKTP